MEEFWQWVGVVGDVSGDLFSLHPKLIFYPFKCFLLVFHQQPVEMALCCNSLLFYFTLPSNFHPFFYSFLCDCARGCAHTCIIHALCNSCSESRVLRLVRSAVHTILMGWKSIVLLILFTSLCLPGYSRHRKIRTQPFIFSTRHPDFSSDSCLVPSLAV